MATNSTSPQTPPPLVAPLSMTQVIELLTALFESLPAKVRARLRWSPASLEQQAMQLLDASIDDALLLRAFDGALHASREVYEGVLLKGEALLVWLLRTARITGQLEQIFSQVIEHTVSSCVAVHPTPQVQEVLASVDAFASYEYAWSVSTLSTFAHVVYKWLSDRWRLWFASVILSDVNLDDKSEGHAIWTEYEDANTWSDLPPLLRVIVVVGVALVAEWALHLGAQAQRQPLELVRLSRDIGRLLASIPALLDQASADLDSLSDDDASNTDTLHLRPLLGPLRVALTPLLAAHQRLTEASELIRAFKHRAALKILDDTACTQDPSGVLERLSQHLRDGTPMTVYRPRLRARSAHAMQTAVEAWSKSRALWAAIGDEGLIDQDDDFDALKRRLQRRAGTVTLMSMGRPPDAP